MDPILFPVVNVDDEYGRRLAAELVQVLDSERSRLVRLAVRRQGNHLTLALNVPDPARFDPSEVIRLARRLAERIAAS